MLDILSSGLRLCCIFDFVYALRKIFAVQLNFADVHQRKKPRTISDEADRNYPVVFICLFFYV